MYPKPLSSGPNCDLNSLNCDPLAVTPSLLSLKMNVALQTIWGSVKYDCVKYCVPTHHSIPLLSAITSMYASLIASLSMAVDILCCKTTRNEVKTNKNITEDAIRFYFYPQKCIRIIMISQIFSRCSCYTVTMWSRDLNLGLNNNKWQRRCHLVTPTNNILYCITCCR